MFDSEAASPGRGFSGDSAGVVRCCVEGMGVVVDSVVISTLLATEVADEAAVGICVDDSPVPDELCRPVLFSAGDSGRRNFPKSLSRFLRFPSDISEILR